ncbi:MAG: tetratricopeptide repeat protein [Phormidesmis sp.]
MKLPNGVRVDSVPVKRQGTVSVAWQPVFLDEARAPVTADITTGGSLTRSNAKSNMQNNVQTALVVKDDLMGVPVTTDESSQNAHAITLHSPPLGTPTTSSSLVLASDSMDEVINIYLEQAQAYCDEDQWEKAFEACQEVLKVAPATAEAYKFLGKILQKQGRPTDAMGFYAKAIMIRPNFPEVYSNLGSLYAQKGKWEEAVSYYQKAIEKDPQLAVAYWNLAKVWKQLNRKDSEMNCRATALRLQPDLGGAKDHFDLAQALESTKNPEGAVLFYQQAVDQDPKMVAAYQRLADLLEDAGDWQAAAVCYRKVLMLNAEAEKVRTAKKMASQSSGQMTGGALPMRNLSPENQQKVRQLLEASKTKTVIGGVMDEGVAPPSVPQLLMSPAEAATLSPTELAKRYADAKDWPRAIEHMRSAIARSPRSASLYRSLAKLFEQNNNPKQAAEAWYRSFELDPSWPDAQQYFTLGRVLARHGHTKAAVLCYRQSIQLQPEFLPVHEALNALVSSSVETVTSAVPQQVMTSKK